MTELEREHIHVYEVRALLGAGGMGEVFRAWDERLQRDVAIKRLRRDLPATDQRRRRLKLEARAVARLNHPAIVQLFDIVEDKDGNDCIVMEWVEGRSLADWIADGTLDGRFTLDLARQVAEGLGIAHNQGLIHRDLKAENVMVDKKRRAKILDFGLAKYRDEKVSHESLTQEGALIGTLRTMSPEQVLGQDIDFRSDLYSLGVLLYEMLLGRSPFAGNNPLELCRNIARQAPPPPRILRPELPKPVAELLESLIDKDPANRPASAESVAARLTDLADLPEIVHLRPLLRPATYPSAAPTAGPMPWPSTLSCEEPKAETTESVPKSPFRFRWRRWAPSAVVLSFALSIAGLYGQGWGPFHRSDELSATHEEQAALSPGRALEVYHQAWADLALHHHPENLDKAIDGFQQVLSSGHMQAAAHAGLARAYWRKYRWRSADPIWLDQSEGLARRAVELDSELAIARVSAGLVAFDRKDFDQARRQIDHALILDANDPEAHFAAARIEYKDGDGDTTRAAIDRALQLGKDDAELHNLRGSSWYQDGTYEEALAAFTVAVDRAPDHIYSLRNLSAAYFKLGQYEEAASAIQRALAIQPSASLYTNLGTLLFYQGLYPQAAEAMEKALSHPSGANTYLHWANLGDVYRQIAGRESSARDAYRRALDLLEEQTGTGRLDIAGQSRRVLYLAKRGDAEQALAVLEASPELIHSDNGNVLYQLAQTYEILGRRQAALEAIRRALAAHYPLDEVRRDPELTELRGDIRFHQILLQSQKDDTDGA